MNNDKRILRMILIVIMIAIVFSLRSINDVIASSTGSLGSSTRSTYEDVDGKRDTDVGDTFKDTDGKRDEGDTFKDSDGTRPIHTHKLIWKKANEEYHEYKCVSCNYSTNYEPHKFGDLQNSGNDKQGKHYKTCSVCGFTKSEFHTFSSTYVADGNGKHSQACTKSGCSGKLISDCVDANGDNKCDFCSQVLSSEPSAPAHEHVISYESVDDKTHKKVCNVCGEELGKEDHKDDNGDQKCDICSYDMKTPAPTHQHTFGKAEQFDDKQHIQRCSCGETLKSNHVDTDGDKICESCGYKMSTSTEPDIKVLSIKYDENSFKAGTDKTATFSCTIRANKELSKSKIEQLISSNKIFLKSADESMVRFSGINATDTGVIVYIKANKVGKTSIFVVADSGAKQEIILNIYDSSTGLTDTDGDTLDLSGFMLTITVPGFDYSNPVTSMSFKQSEIVVTEKQTLDLLKYLDIKPDNADYTLLWTITDPNIQNVSLSANGKAEILNTTSNFSVKVEDLNTKKASSIKIRVEIGVQEEDGITKPVPEDVSNDAWYLQYVMQAIEQGIMQGVDDDHFKPDSKLTRGQFVTALHRLDKSQFEGTPTTSFLDVDVQSYYAEAVAWASEKGIVNGMGDGTFAPDKEIKREEIATMIYRYLKHAAPSLLPAGTDIKYTAFKDDSKISDWAHDPIYILAYLKIITGKDNSKFDPQGKVTRAESATLLVRIHDFMNSKYNPEEDVDLITPDPAQDAPQYNVYKGSDLLNKGGMTRDYLLNNPDKLEELNNNLAESIKAAGPKTRAAAVSAALFLCGQSCGVIPYRGVPMCRSSNKEYIAGCYPYKGFNKNWAHYTALDRDVTYNGKVYKSGSRHMNGMDCGAFMIWCMVQADIFPEGMINEYGQGTQYYESDYRFNGKKIAPLHAHIDIAEPGDFLFGVSDAKSLTTCHIGMFVGKDDNAIYIAEASGNAVCVNRYDYDSYRYKNYYLYHITGDKLYTNGEGNMPVVDWSK